MIRLSLLQFRVQAYVAGALLAATAIMLGVSGPSFAHLYDTIAKAQAACANSPTCGHEPSVSTVYALIELIGTLLVAVPALVGAFWGAPLISREFENGTHRLAWTQSVTRARWVAVKLAVGGIASVVATGALSLMVTWWSSPMDRANRNQFGSGLFGERNITPLGYAAFGFALGVAAGVLIRRALPAMATTLGLFLGVRLAFTYLVRPHLISPRHLTTSLESATQGFGTSNGGPPSLFLGAPGLPNAWVYSTKAVDGSGHALTAQIVRAACPQLGQPGPVPAGSGQAVQAPDSGRDVLQACITKLSPSYHAVVTYQPASRYWLFQVYETGIYVLAALALVAFSFYWLRRHSG